MHKHIAQAISVVFHPVWVNLLSLVCLIYLFPGLNYVLPQKLKIFFVAFIFITTGILPLLLILVLKLTGRVKSITLDKSNERRLPYLITLALYFFCYYNFLKLGTSPYLLKYLLGCTLIILMVATINYFYKISVHMASLGALAAVIAAASAFTEIRLLLSFIVLTAGLVGSARLFLNAHGLNQILTGFISGFIIMWLIL